MILKQALRPIGLAGTAILSGRVTRNFRLLPWTVLIGLCLLLSAPARAEPEAPTARSILERAAKLQGGGALAEKGAIKDFYVHLRVKKYEPGDGTRADGWAKQWYMPPSASRKWPLMKKWWDSSAETTSGLTFKSTPRRAFERAWSKQGRQVTWLSPTNAKQRKSIERLRREAKDMDLLLRTFLLKNLLGKDATLELLPSMKRGERRVLCVKRTAPGDPMFIIWIDAENHDLVGVQLPALKEGQVEQTFSFSKSKEFQGVRVPKLIEIFERTFAEKAAAKPPRSTTEAVVVDLKLNQGLTKKDFDPPRPE